MITNILFKMEEGMRHVIQVYTTEDSLIGVFGFFGVLFVSKFHIKQCFFVWLVMFEK